MRILRVALVLLATLLDNSRHWIVEPNIQLQRLCLVEESIQE